MADAGGGKVTSKISKKRWACGVPDTHCCGSLTKLSAGLRKGLQKTHAAPEEAFKCHADYLVSVCGFKKVGSREFEPPDGGPIRVLTKKSRFGAMLRGGKEGRAMPRAFPGGTMVSI